MAEHTPSDASRRLLKQLATARRDRDIRQDIAAKEIGTSQASFSFWESGRRSPNLTVAARWAVVVGGALIFAPNADDVRQAALEVLAAHHGEELAALILAEKARRRSTWSPS